MDAAIAVLAPSLLAVAGIFFARRLYRVPTSRLAPNALKHTWVSGVGYSGLLLGFLALPALLLERWDVAILGLVAGLALLAGPFRAIVVGMLHDLRAHRSDGRTLFQHDVNCAVHPSRHPHR